MQAYYTYLAKIKIVLKEQKFLAVGYCRVKCNLDNFCQIISTFQKIHQKNTKKNEVLKTTHLGNKFIGIYQNKLYLIFKI